MKIVPTSSILIAGQHCEAGQPIEVADTLGALLIAERQAKPAATVEAEASPALEVEAAATAPAVEIAALHAKPARKAKA